MQIEIWSDVACPFCYIGKRKFETALEQFLSKKSSYKERIQIIWKSFQLAPDLITQPDISIHEFLAEHKNISIEEAKGLNDNVTEWAKQVGLTYNFDKAVVANSFNAHRFSHFTKKYDKQNEAEEKLFQAYFTEGQNIDDIPTLVQLGVGLGLDSDELKAALESDMYAEAVNSDIYEARQLRIQGVPFFVFNRKYAVSGAQNSEVFLNTLEKSYSEWKEGLQK